MARSPALVRPAPATAVLGLGTLISHGFGLSLLPAMLPRIADDFGVGYGLLGGIAAIGLVAYTGGALAASRIVDRVPGRELLLGSFAVSGIGLLGAAAAPSPLALTAAAVLLGAAAPVSWAVSLHVAGTTVAVASRATVMAGAAGGAAVGVLINGVLVQTSSDLHSWRVSFLVAAALTVLPIAGGWRLFRTPIAPPAADVRAGRGAGYRAIAASRAGRVVVGAAVVAGAIGWPFTVFLTATALDEMEVSALAAALLWWMIGGIGTFAGPVIGRYGDRGSPLGALTAGALAFAAGLVVLAASWSYAGLVAASVGLAVLYYPIWGLVGAVANTHFPPQQAVRAISMGLIGAALLGAAANAAAGAWIDATDSFRAPVAIMAGLMAVTALWHVSIGRRGGLGDTLRAAEREREPGPTAYDLGQLP